MQAEIWTKTDCSFCIKAKEELTKRNIPYKENVIGLNCTKEDLLKVVPSARTVPQIFIDGILIGGYTDLMDLK